MVAHVRDNAVFSIMPVNPKKKLCPAYKVIVLGSARVGKSTLVRQLATSSRIEMAAAQASIAGDYVERMAHVRDHERLVKVQLWDTAGQGAWGSGATALPNSYFRGARGAVLVFDAANRASFTEILTTWVHHVANFHSNSERFSVTLVANQTSPSTRQVSADEGQWLAKVIQADHYFECTPADRHFDACFNAIATSLAAPAPWRVDMTEVASAAQRLRSAIHKPKPRPLTLTTTAAPSFSFQMPKLQSPTVQLVPPQYCLETASTWSPLPLEKLHATQRRAAELLMLLSLLLAACSDRIVRVA